MAINYRVLAAGLAVLLLGVAACGSDAVIESVLEQQPEVGDVDVDTSDDTFSVSIESEEGDIQVEMGTGDLPEGFPFPIADGGTVVSSSTLDGPDGMAWQAAVDYPTDRFDAVVAFYEEFLNDQDFEVISSVTESGSETLVSLIGEKDEASAGVIVTRHSGGATVNLTWIPETG